MSIVNTFSTFVNNITTDGKFQPESGRYHLYISGFCPYAQRANIALKLKGLEDAISVSVLDFIMKDGLLWFGTDIDKPHKGVTVDHLYGFKTLKELYEKADKQQQYTGKHSVPVLWDRKLETIVSNESHDIVRIFNSQLNNLAKYPNVNLYPEEIGLKIDKDTDWFMKNVVGQVFKQSSQEEYELSAKTFFETIEELDRRLSTSRYMFGKELTEFDIKVFVVLIRFELCLFPSLKLNLHPLTYYNNLYNYTKELYQHPQIKSTVYFDHIKGFFNIGRPGLADPKILPLGPNLDHYESPYQRTNL
ncbi:hypothetical protein DLAC_01996 [Tieghemostelium lacteum]|uniref:GST N-terminal domain-containing protein n=1 Tax=Tieghemostelium lacteum TaxID=361077 RepID=A0A152A591_TIELA|nr:hypothetical protein DLAC_01996 [Tieghemostelium lacteum]|eukprot:KYR01406.1 hypothetical protein DLAC_01996 [Tieghemostelium lacteum]